MATAPAAVERVTAEPRTVTLYPINTYWPGKGGIFRGIVPSKDGAPDRLLFEHTETFAKANWQAQKDAAAALDVDGHKDFELPDEVEAAVIYGVAKADHEPYWYWLRTQPAEDPSSAWLQDFYHGGQGWLLQYHVYRARAVRSEPI